MTGANTNLVGHQEGWELGVKEAEGASVPVGTGLSLMAALQVRPTPGWPKASLPTAIPCPTVLPALALTWKALEKRHVTIMAGVRLNTAVTHCAQFCAVVLLRDHARLLTEKHRPPLGVRAGTLPAGLW